MKVSVLLFALTILVSCTNNTRPEASIDNLYVSDDFPTDSVVVYGNFHLVGPEVMSLEDLASFKEAIVSTQHWLYDTISEEIILLEGFPLDSQITLQHYKDFYRSNNNKELSESSIELLKETSPDYDVQIRFILEGKKKLFGSEDKELYDLISDAAIKNPALNMSKDLIDLRSISIAENAKDVSRFYNKRVAVIVGDNHLDWFEKQGFPVYHPPATR